MASRCPICKKFHRKNTPAHHIELVSCVGDPLAFTISVVNFHMSDEIKARTLAFARAELRRYFPDKQFDVQPSYCRMARDFEVYAGLEYVAHIFVASYIAVEI